MYMAVTDRFPNISTVRVKDAIQQVQDLLSSLAQGVSAASLVTILAGLLVLAGAIAAGARARAKEAATLKVLGAARGQILAAYVVEDLALAIDPFPRKPGVEFEAPDAPGEPSPFAVLAKLKGGAFGTGIVLWFGGVEVIGGDGVDAGFAGA